MRIHNNLSAKLSINKPVVTTGTFDGVHLGHQTIIKSLKEEAERVGGETVLFTFWPHPRLVIFPKENDLRLLNTQAEKIKELEKAGIDHLVVIPFTLDFSKISALQYVRDILVNLIGVHTMVIGHDHQFGKNRKGNFDYLLELAEMFDFKVREIPALDIENVSISSTKIRKALQLGNVKLAEQFLGYAYSITGEVVEGQQIGRSIGYPTANVLVDEKYKLIPSDGVYAVNVFALGNKYRGMLNIGVRPTIIKETERTIEVFLEDFSENLYQEEITIEFVARIRDEKKFESLDDLKIQLGEDRRCLPTYFTV